MYICVCVSVCVRLCVCVCVLFLFSILLRGFAVTKYNQMHKILRWPLSDPIACQMLVTPKPLHWFSWNLVCPPSHPSMSNRVKPGFHIRKMIPDWSPTCPRPKCWNDPPLVSDLSQTSRTLSQISPTEENYKMLVHFHKHAPKSVSLQTWRGTVQDFFLQPKLFFLVILLGTCE